MSTMLRTHPTPVDGHHAIRARTPWWRLLLGLAVRFKVQYLLDAPATHSWMILRRKYDAFTTDVAYETQPRSWLGPIGRPAARRVMNYPIHVALRDRLTIVATTLAELIEQRRQAVAATAGGPAPVRVLSAPCGLCRDVMTAAQRLGPAAGEVIWHGLDLDARGDVLPEARRRTQAAGLAMTFFREDLTDPDGLAARAGQEPYDLVNCIGLATWLSLEEVGQLAQLYHRRVLRPGGRLVIDNWARHAHSRAGEELEIHANYHPAADFRQALTAAGLVIEREQATANGACTVYVAVAPEHLSDGGRP